MEQFVVPQFIDTEDKILGPITVRQFLIMLVTGGIIFVAYKLSDFVLFVFEFAFFALVGFTLAFVKVSGRPIHYFILNFIQTMKRPRLRVWQKQFSVAELKRFSSQAEIILPPAIYTKNKVRASRLAEMSLIVDTGGVYQGEKEPPTNPAALV